MKIEGRHEREVTLCDYEALLLAAVKALFASKSDYGDGADFRQAFVSELMGGYCDACGIAWGLTLELRRRHEVPVALDE